MKRILITLLAVLLAWSLGAQTTGVDLQSQLEELVASVLEENENADVEQLWSELEWLQEHPLNINQAGRGDFQRLYFLSSLQIDQLLEYREEYGPIYSPFELNAMEGFDPELIQLLQVFVVFGDEAYEPASFGPRQELMLRAIRLVEKQKGFREPAKYEGSPEKLYLRYRFSSPGLAAGLTSEKDAGESFFSGANPYGFDYYSAFATITLGQRKHQLFLGDYLVRFGQGLTAWQGFSLSKSAEVSQVARFNQGIRSYSSTDENNFLRGAAARFSIRDWTWHTFVSYKSFDANRDSIDGEAVFTSFQSSGLHRTSSEIEDKNSVEGVTTGTNLTYAAEHFSIGLSAVHFRYELPLARKPADYNLFYFEGKQLSNAGLNYQWGVNRYYFFGEASWSSGGGLATMHGLQASPADAVEYAMVYRNISKKYQAPLAGSFTEGSQVNDEQGIYLGLIIRPAAKLSLRMYADFFEHQWVKYTTAAPGRGREYLVQANYKLSDRWDVYSRYFNERKPVKVSGTYTKMNLNQTRQKLRVQLNGTVGERFLLKSRMEWMWYEHDQNADGWLVFQDLGYKNRLNTTNWWLRLAYFKTDNYDSRIYAYENDLLYQFSVPAFYGEGIRFYMNGKVKICENIEAWMKASRSWLLGVNSIGSGYSEIDGNQRTEVKFQLRFKF